MKTSKNEQQGLLQGLSRLPVISSLPVRYLRPLSPPPRSSIYLGIKPIQSISRETKDALLDLESASSSPAVATAASVAFGSVPVSSLSQEWVIVVVFESAAGADNQKLAAIFEIDGGAQLVTSHTVPQPWRDIRCRDLSWRFPRIGYTYDTIEDVRRKAIRISWPMRYSTYSENCQKFAYMLFEAIRLPQDPPKVSDLLSGLDVIPAPFETLKCRCQAVVLTTSIKTQEKVVAVIDKTIGTPARKMFAYGSWVKDILTACLILGLLAVKVGIQLIGVVWSLLWDRDLSRTSGSLRKIAWDVGRVNMHDGSEISRARLE